MRVWTLLHECWENFQSTKEKEIVSANGLLGWLQRVIPAPLLPNSSRDGMTMSGLLPKPKTRNSPREVISFTRPSSCITVYYLFGKGSIKKKDWVQGQKLHTGTRRISASNPYTCSTIHKHVLSWSERKKMRGKKNNKKTADAKIHDAKIK